MASVTSLGTGSGLELEGMVTKLMAVEQLPITALQKKVTSHETRISSLGTLSSSLASLQTAAKALKTEVAQTASEKYASFSASASDTKIATVSTTIDADVVAGSYKLTNIVTATAQQIRKSGISAPKEAGSLTIQVGSGSAVTVSIGAGETLASISSEINNSGAGVTTTVVNDGTKDYLVVTANSTGKDNTISITGSGTGWDAFNYSSSASNSWAVQTTPSDASLNIDGIAVTSASNDITSISGLKISLLAAADSATVTVTKDATTKLTDALKAFVTAYNSAAKTMSEMGAYDAKTKKAGALQGDSTLRTAQNQIRSMLFGTKAGGSSNYQILSDIGISVGSDGTLSLNTTKLNKAISADYAGVANLVAKAGSAYDTALKGIVGDDGLVTAATKSTNKQIAILEERKTTLTARLTTIEKMYRTQFSALDTLVSKLNKSSSYLTQQMDALNKSSS